MPLFFFLINSFKQQYSLTNDIVMNYILNTFSSIKTKPPSNLYIQCKRIWLTDTTITKRFIKWESFYLNFVSVLPLIYIQLSYDYRFTFKTKNVIDIRPNVQVSIFYCIYFRLLFPLSSCIRIANNSFTAIYSDRNTNLSNK